MNFEELLKHVGHEIGIDVNYGHGSEPTIIRINCLTCNTELVSADETEKALFDKLARHVDHPSCSLNPVDHPKYLVVVCYGIKGEPAANVAIECEDCSEVLVDYERPDKKAER